jgi:hypothetical protein
VKFRFSNSNGTVRTTWSTKRVKDMADEMGLLRQYETAYRMGSDLIHSGPTGLISHELSWDFEALVTGHGSMLQTVSSLYNVSMLVPPELGRKLEAQSREGEAMRKRYVEKRDRGRSDRSTAE